MERRRDHRHTLSYPVSVRCKRTQRVLMDLATKNVSASGMLLGDHLPDLEVGDQAELQVVVEILGRNGRDAMVMATEATVVRTDIRTAAFYFRVPLAY